MNPSALRISAIRTFKRDDGISTFSCSARLALRMRVSRSATGSLLMGASPAGLDHARDLAFERQLPEAQPTHLELAQITAGPAAQQAAAVPPRGKPGRLQRLHDERGLGHAASTL